MKENKVSVNGIDIIFKFKQKKYDTKHLIVVFSGFGGSGEFTYDMERALQEVQANILWIKDDFFGHCSYYICHEMDFKIREAVHSFILKYLNELSLDKENCTLAGFSKGGSAALYFGLNFNFPNIVATVPQFHIGSYVAKNWKVPAKHMLMDINEKNIRILDSLLPSVLKKDKFWDKNIYLLSSPADIQYETEIAPYLVDFMKYKNFNFFFSKSQLVRAHNQVTAHHVPLLLSIFYSLSSGAVPRYGYVELLGDQKIGSSVATYEPIALLRRIDIRNGRIFPDGVSIIRGVPCENWGDISTSLILENRSNKFTIPLAKDHRPNLSREFYQDGYVCYDKGWFTSLKHEGLDISFVEPGVYKAYINIKCNGYEKITLLKSESKISISKIISEFSISVETDSDLSIFFKKMEC